MSEKRAKTPASPAKPAFEGKLGRSKASKAAAVEELALSARSEKILSRAQSSRLKGDALRSAIRRSLVVYGP
jgi:hypothetical protein